MLEQFLTKRNISFQKTEEGIYYHLEGDGSGRKPENGEFVKVHYTGTFLDGKKFDSSVDRNQPFVFQVGGQQVIQGWDLGLKLFSVGQKGSLYLPPELAYGERGAKGAIPPNASLIFEIELLDILTEEEHLAHQREEEARQRKAIEEFIQRQMEVEVKEIELWAAEKGLPLQPASAGFYVHIAEEGTGPQAEKGKPVQVHYKGSLLNGQMFDSSYQRGKPFGFDLGAGRVIPGWDLGIPLFKEGGKGTLVIPSPLGYGPRDMGAIPPNSTLVFEIEVVKVG
ncbi:MAG: FKBP-type peptidyl-prolyl cis-trans isomerase [Bacteroidota bacterium]